jgi:hypothetical protein
VSRITVLLPDETVAKAVCRERRLFPSAFSP